MNRSIEIPEDEVQSAADQAARSVFKEIQTAMGRADLPEARTVTVRRPAADLTFRVLLVREDDPEGMAIRLRMDPATLVGAHLRFADE